MNFWNWPHERSQRWAPEHATLIEWSQDGHFVVFGSSKGASLVQMNGKRFVAKERNRFVVMPVHVADQKIENGQINQIGQVSTFVIRCRQPHCITVIIICVEKFIIIENNERNQCDGHLLPTGPSCVCGRNVARDVATPCEEPETYRVKKLPTMLLADRDCHIWRAPCHNNNCIYLNQSMIRSRKFTWKKLVNFYRENTSFELVKWKKFWVSCR